MAAKRKVLFVLPFVSVVEEKVEYLQHVFEPLNLVAKGFYANQGSAYFSESIDIAVCTMEKVVTFFSN